MKVKRSVTLVELHGQYYARWRTEELYLNKAGKEVHKEYFEPTGVRIPPEGSSEEDIEEARTFAADVGEYMAHLSSPRPPCSQLQQTKLREFAIKAVKADANPIPAFIAEWIVAHAHRTDKHGKPCEMDAVATMVSTWHRVLDGLGASRKLHPCSIPTSELQKVIDELDGKQERHVINVRAAYKYGEETGRFLRGQNPAEDLRIKGTESVNRIPFPKAAIEDALAYMGKIIDGEQWQLLTLCGVYTPMRFLTACRLRLSPAGFVRPEHPGPYSVLDTSCSEWIIEFYDTKGKKWEVQILDGVFVLWLQPYIAKHKLKAGDYMFPKFARLHSPPCARWQNIVEKSGYDMVYSKDGNCRTGYHALRISHDMWLRENDQVVLSQEVIDQSLRHTGAVHRRHYNSQSINVLDQRRVNAARPKIYPPTLDVEAQLTSLKLEKERLLASLHQLSQEEARLAELKSKQSNPNTND